MRRTLDLRDAMQGVLDKYPDRIELTTGARDIERIVGQRKIAAVLTIEGGHQIAMIWQSFGCVADWEFFP